MSLFTNSRQRSDKNVTVLIFNRPLFLGAGPQSSMCPGCTEKTKPTAYNFRSFDFQSGFFSQSLLWPVPMTGEIFIVLKSKGHKAVLTALHHFPFQWSDVAADLQITIGTFISWKAFVFQLQGSEMGTVFFAWFTVFHYPVWTLLVQSGHWFFDGDSGAQGYSSGFFTHCFLCCLCTQPFIYLFLFTHRLFLWFVMEFKQQFRGPAEICRYPQLWCFTVGPQWLQALNLKSDDQLHQSLSSSKSGWVFVSGHPYQENDKGRAGEFDMSWGGKALGNVGDAGRNCNVDCHLTLKGSKVQNLQGHINFYFLSLIFLLPSCSNNLPWGAASFACAGSWPRLHHLAMAVSSPLCSSCWKPGSSSMEWWEPDRGDVNSSLLIDSPSTE